MAEGLLRAWGKEAYEVWSAGIQPRTLHPLAIKVMQEIGIDISSQRAKGLDEIPKQPPMDLVITVCDEAAEACPHFPHALQQLHWSFPDPSLVEGKEEEGLATFRQVRDLIAAHIQQLLRQHAADSLL
jgi:arsenate reductase